MNEKEHVHWFCPTCDAKVMKYVKIEKQFEERCEEFHKKVEHRINQLKVDIKAKVDETRVVEMIKKANIKNPQIKSLMKLWR